MNKTLKEMLMETEWKVVSERMICLYPEQEQNLVGYHKVFDALIEMESSGDDSVKIHLEEIVDEFDGEVWINISGIGDEDQSWAVEFSPWRDWLSWSFTSAALLFDPLDIICHVLYEMTFCGYDEDDIAMVTNKISDAYQGVLDDAELISYENWIVD